MQTILTAVYLLLFATSLAGWGALLERISRGATGNVATQATLGTSVVLALGGVLNVASLVSRLTLTLLLAAGLVMFIRHYASAVLNSRNLIARVPRVETVLLMAVIAGVVTFTIITQLPPKAYNHHDDLHKYLAHPVRQLATGTLRGSPLSALGSETLGGMAFLQSFILAYRPLEFINGIDAVFGLVLLMALVASAAGGSTIPCLAAGGALLVYAIEPQYVNVSALYSSAALMGCAVLIGANSFRRGACPPAAQLGLLYAALVALKTTGLLFSLTHFAATLVPVLILHGSRDGLKWGLRVIAWTLLAVAPWIILHIPHYLAAGDLEAIIVPQGTTDSLAIFSLKPLFYGGYAASYTGLVLLALVSSALALAGRRHWTAFRAWPAPTTAPPGEFSALVFAFSSAVCCASVFVVFVSSANLLAGFDTSIRYAVPFILGIVPVVVTLSISELWRAQNRRTAIPLLIAVVVVGLSFVPARARTIALAWQHGTIMAFAPTSPQYANHTSAALSPARHALVHSLQAKAPAGVPLLAWIEQPFFLDHSRNQILDIEPAGLARSWARIPSDAKYLIWEVAGYGVRSLAQYEAGTHVAGANERRISVKTLRFIREVDPRVKLGTILHFDGKYLVARLGDTQR